MPSTYTPNNGIEIIATGEQSGTWGDTTNTNLELIDVALDGQLIKTLAVPGISSSPNALAITDGDQSDGRNRLIVFTDGGDLGSTAYVQLTPNDAEKIIYVRNDLAGGRSIIFFQGTYNASNDFELPAGKDAIVKFNGGGSGAITSAVFEDLYLANATVGTLVNTNLQVSNIAALDGTSAGSIADSTGVVTLASSVLTTADINGGTLDNVTIGGDTPAAATFTTATATNVQVTNIKANDGTSAVTIADSTGVVTIPSVVSTNVQVTNIKANDGTSAMTIADSTGIVTFAAGTTGTTQTLTTIEVTNINAHDGTASATIADATGVMTVASSVLTTTDINGGTIDGVTIGGAVAGAGTFTSVTGTSLDMNGNADFSGLITLSQTGGTTLRRTDDAGYVVVGGGTSIALGSNITLHGSSHPTSPNYTIVEGDSMFFRPVDNNPEFLRFVDGTGAVFNEEGADHDFRIESDTNTHAFFLQGSDGNVGIGTSAPSSLLEIASSATSQTLPGIPTLRITNTDTTVTANDIVGSVEFFSKDASDPDAVTGFVRNIAQDAGVGFNLAFGTKAATIGSDATERMRITAAGNIGIGTSSPSTLFHVNGIATFSDDVTIGGELNLTEATNNFVDHFGTLRMRYYDGAAFYDTMSISATATVFNDTGRDHDFRIESDTNANAFFLQGSDGKIGIGTGSPLQPLHVNSSGNTQLLVSSSFNNSTNTGLTVDTVGDSSAFRLNVTKSGAVQGTFRYLHAATSADQAWEFAASGSVVYKAGYAEHIWKTGNTERLRINSSGNVGIGTDSPAQKLDVNGTIKGTGFSTASTTNPITYMDQNVVWAPTFLSSGGGETISYTVNSGQYCRYGEWVTCAGRIVVLQSHKAHCKLALLLALLQNRRKWGGHFKIR
jgi:trimeric autotransporter adhesin